MPKFVINQEDFLRGAAENDFINNGGYSPADKSGNIYVKRGILAPPPLVTENTAVVETITRFIQLEKGLGAPVRGFGVDSGNDGWFYTFSDAAIAANTSEDTGRDYHASKSDIVFYAGNFYVSSTTDIAKFDDDMETPDYDWWTDTKSGTALNQYLPCQLLVSAASGNNMMYGHNESNIISYDGTDISNSAFAIPDSYYITAIVEYNNKIYIAAEAYFNASGAYHGKAAIFVWDGFSSTYENVYPNIQDRIDCMYVFQGNLLFFTRRYMGYWNGINITYLHDLKHQVFKGMLTQYMNRLYIAQDKAILVYDGERFSYLLELSNDVDAIICPQYGDLFISSDKKTSLSYVNNEDLNGVAKVGTGYWRSRRYHFGQNVIIKNITIELAQALSSGSVINFSLIDQDDTETSIGSMTYADDAAIKAKELKNINLKMLSMQLRVNWNAVAKQIIRFTIEYEPTENPI